MQRTPKWVYVIAMLLVGVFVLQIIILSRLNQVQNTLDGLGNTYMKREDTNNMYIHKIIDDLGILLEDQRLPE